MRVSLFFLFSRLVTISKPPSLQAAPKEHRATAERGLHPSTHPLSQPPRQTNPASHTSTTHTHSHTHTHTPPTETQKVCATLPAPRAQICSGGCCFSAVIALLSISTERKARGRKVKSRRRKKAWSVAGNSAEEKAQISGTSKPARGASDGQ